MTLEYLSRNIKKNTKIISNRTKVKSTLMIKSKNTLKLPKEHYFVRAQQEFYQDLKDVKHDDKNLKKSLKLGKRCLETIAKNGIMEPPTKDH